MTAPTADTWEAYSQAIFEGYGVEPARSAKINGQITNLLKQIPKADAPGLAAWYVSHPAECYQMSNHDFGLLLRDVHKLYTEWRTGKTLTRRQASQASQAAVEGDVWAQLAAIYDVDLVKALALTAKMTRTEFDFLHAKAFLKFLDGYDKDQLLPAFRQCCKELSGRLVVNDVISRIPRRRVEHQVYKALPRRERTISFAEGIKMWKDSIKVKK